MNLKSDYIAGKLSKDYLVDLKPSYATYVDHFDLSPEQQRKFPEAKKRAAEIVHVTKM